MIYTIEKETEKKAKVCAVSTIFIYTGKMCLEIKSKAHEKSNSILLILIF